MNALQRDFQKLQKRKKKIVARKFDNVKKTGRMKVRVRLEKEHQKKILEAKLKVEQNTDTTSNVIEVSPTTK